MAAGGGRAGLDLPRIGRVYTPGDPFAAAQQAVLLARNGEVRALIKGSLYPDDLMRAVAAPDSGLRSDRRLTHAVFVDVPNFARPFLLSDAVLTIPPTLASTRKLNPTAIALPRA